MMHTIKFPGGLTRVHGMTKSDRFSGFTVCTSVLEFMTP